jgi:hypothetical protein
MPGGSVWAALRPGPGAGAGDAGPPAAHTHPAGHGWHGGGGGPAGTRASRRMRTRSAPPPGPSPPPTTGRSSWRATGATSSWRSTWSAGPCSGAIPAARGIYNVEVTSDGRSSWPRTSRTTRSRSSTWRSGEERARIPTHRRVVHGVVISPDDRYAFVTVEGVGSEPGTLEVLDLGADRSWPGWTFPPCRRGWPSGGDPAGSREGARARPLHPRVRLLWRRGDGIRAIVWTGPSWPWWTPGGGVSARWPIVPGVAPPRVAPGGGGGAGARPDAGHALGALPAVALRPRRGGPLDPAGDPGPPGERDPLPAAPVRGHPAGAPGALDGAHGARGPHRGPGDLGADPGLEVAEAETLRARLSRFGPRGDGTRDGGE